MFFFFHLLAGIILGFLVAELLSDKRWILPCAIGSILPDLIDKPLGHIVFASTIGDGRIFTHTLIIVILVLIVGAYFWNTLRDPTVIALGIGLLSHQVLDLMWLSPSNWYYPAMGSFRGGYSDTYIWTLLSGEIQNSFDVGLAFIIAGFALILLFHGQFEDSVRRNCRFFRHLFGLLASVLCAVAGICLGWGISRHTIGQLGWNHPDEVIIVGIMSAIAAWLVWRWRETVN